MKTYRNVELGFQMEIPEDWSPPKSGGVQSTIGKLVILTWDSNEYFSLTINQLPREESLNQVENEIREQARFYNFSSLGLGRFIVDGKQHVWMRYYNPRIRKWCKKYFIALSGTGYLVMGYCDDQNMLLKREKVWDAVVASFHRLAQSAAKSP